jgi:hypothetical protein
MIRDAIPHSTDAKLVPRIPLMKELDDAPHPLPLALAPVDPPKNRDHCNPLKLEATSAATLGTSAVEHNKAGKAW